MSHQKTLLAPHTISLTPPWSGTKSSQPPQHLHCPPQNRLGPNSAWSARHTYRPDNIQQGNAGQTRLASARVDSWNWMRMNGKSSSVGLENLVLKTWILNANGWKKQQCWLWKFNPELKKSQVRKGIRCHKTQILCQGGGIRLSLFLINFKELSRVTSSLTYVSSLNDTFRPNKFLALQRKWLVSYHGEISSTPKVQSFNKSC